MLFQFNKSDLLARMTMEIYAWAGIMLLLGQSANANTGLRAYCQFETFNATCGRDSVVVMDTARYGRMEFGRCVDRDYGYVGCFLDVLLPIDRRCSGRFQCTVAVPDATLHSMQPCPHDLSAYLQASYRCQPVVTDPLIGCPMGMSLVTSSSGFLASASSYRDGIGTELCPWVIEVDPGKRVRLTLWDFNLESESASNPDYCRAYAVIREPSSGSSHTVCGGSNRVEPIYTSRTHRVEIRLIFNSENTNHDFFNIEFEAFGCPAIPNQPNMKVDYDGDKAFITCEQSQKQSTLVCQSGIWTGNMDNCTAGGTWGFPGNRLTPLSMELTVAVIAGIAFFVIVCVLGVGIFCLRRHHHRNHEPSTPGGLLPPSAQYVSQKMSDKYQPPINDPRDVRSASEGDYSGIWERQYGTHPGPQSNQQSRTQSLGYHPTALPGLERSTNYNGNRSREHIYESPKFDTCSASGCPGDFPVPVYFELETDRPGHPPKYTAKYQQ